MIQFRPVILCAFVFCTALTFAPAQDAAPESLTYMCEDLPPSNYLENGELKGFSVELLALVWKKMGIPAQQIKVVPWARGYILLQDEKNQVLFSMTRTAERETLFKWVGPIFTVSNVLLARADSGLVIKTLEDAKRFRIGTVKDDVVEKYLLEKKFEKKRVESVSALEQNFEKLRLGRIDLIAHSQSSLLEVIREKKLDPAGYSVCLVLSTSPNYFAFSADVPYSLTYRFQAALDGLAAEHKVLLKKYDLSF